MHRRNSTVSTKNFFMSSPHGNIKRYARQADQLHAQRITRRMKLVDNFVRVEFFCSPARHVNDICLDQTAADLKMSTA